MSNHVRPNAELLQFPIASAVHADDAPIMESSAEVTDLEFYATTGTRITPEASNTIKHLTYMYIAEAHEDRLARGKSVDDPRVRQLFATKAFRHATETVLGHTIEVRSGDIIRRYYGNDV